MEGASRCTLYAHSSSAASTTGAAPTAFLAKLAGSGETSFAEGKDRGGVSVFGYAAGAPPPPSHTHARTRTHTRSPFVCEGVLTRSPFVCESVLAAPFSHLNLTPKPKVELCPAHLSAARVTLSPEMPRAGGGGGSYAGLVLEVVAGSGAGYTGKILEYSDADHAVQVAPPVPYHHPPSLLNYL